MSGTNNKKANNKKWTTGGKAALAATLVTLASLAGVMTYKGWQKDQKYLASLTPAQLKKEMDMRKREANKRQLKRNLEWQYTKIEAMPASFNKELALVQLKKNIKKISNNKKS